MWNRHWLHSPVPLTACLSKQECVPQKLVRPVESQDLTPTHTRSGPLSVSFTSSNYGRETRQSLSWNWIAWAEFRSARFKWFTDSLYTWNILTQVWFKGILSILVFKWQILIIISSLNATFSGSTEQFFISSKKKESCQRMFCKTKTGADF